ncbi:MAG: LCP family protein [Clostridiales bacterium]|nr:LCP family protein [Clostridiales bacterium]
MMSFRRFLALLLALLLMPAVQLVGLAEEDRLTDEQLRDLLYELSLQEDASSDYIVLPDDFRMPATGLDGEYRLLIVGVDSDAPKVTGRSDTMILAVLNTRQKTLKLISFMRDLYVSIPGRGHNRLNAAYVYGGQQLLRRTLEESFGVVADAYVAVNYSLMAELVDAIGGVELTVEEYELKPLNGILGYYNYQRERPEEEGMLAASGTRILTGLQAMSYARIRKVDSDFERVGRQQRVLRAIYERVMQLPIDRLGEVILTFIDRIRTDISMTDALNLLQDLLQAGDLRIDALSIPVSKSFSSKMINKAYFLVPNIKRNRAAIADFLSAQ